MKDSDLTLTNIFGWGCDAFFSRRGFELFRSCNPTNNVGGRILFYHCSLNKKVRQFSKVLLTVVFQRINYVCRYRNTYKAV